MCVCHIVGRVRFTALMMGPGATVGSLHIKFPAAWTSDPARNHGHVPWPSDSARVWKLEVACALCTMREAFRPLHTLVSTNWPQRPTQAGVHVGHVVAVV